MLRWMLLGLLACTAPFASAQPLGVPDPTMSDFDPCLVVCPSGDYHFRGVVRDAVRNPIASSVVGIDFTPCPVVAFCPLRPEDPYVINGRVVFAVTDIQGRVDFPLRAGGICPTAVQIQADGVPMGSRRVASYDQDGNLLVEMIDRMIVGLKVGTSDPTADFDCDGTVTRADEDILWFSHEGHRCDMPVPVRHATWGRVKSIYR